MNNRKKIFISLRDSLLWVFLTSCIGLVQILLYLMASSFIEEREFDIFLWLKNGSIVAFSLALVASIFFDTHFQMSHRRNLKSDLDSISEEYFGGLFYKLLPWVVILMVTFTTMIDIFVDGEAINKKYLLNTQIASVVMAYLYTLYFKYCSFYVGMRNDI